MQEELLSFLRRATQQRSGVIGCKDGIWGGGTRQGGEDGYEHARSTQERDGAALQANRSNKKGEGQGQVDPSAGRC